MDDLISRQAAIDELERMRNFYSVDDCPNIYAEYKRIIDEINNLPSAQPEQRKGKWIKQEGFLFYENQVYKCSECGKYVVLKHNYCSDCGADMRGENK